MYYYENLRAYDIARQISNLAEMLNVFDNTRKRFHM